MVLNGKPFVVKSRDVPGGVPVFSKTHFEKRDDGKSQAGFSRYKQVSCIDELTFALENDQIRCSKPTTVSSFLCHHAVAISVQCCFGPKTNGRLSVLLAR